MFEIYTHTHTYRMVKKRSSASCREVEGGGGRISTGYSSSLRSTAATTVSKEGENACSNSRLQNSSRSQHFSLQTEDFCFSISRMSCFRFLRSSHSIVVWRRQTCSDWNFEKKKRDSDEIRNIIVELEGSKHFSISKEIVDSK